MLYKIIAIIIVLICTVRIIGYGVYTLKTKNITGGIGLFVMAVFVAASSAFFFVVK